MPTGLGLTQRQTLQTKLSPQQIQVIRLLEVPGVELERRINEELQENPALDEGVEQPLEYTGDTQEVDDIVNGEVESAPDNADEYQDSDDYAASQDADSYDFSDYTSDDETPDYLLRSDNYDNLPATDLAYADGTSFNEYLKSQVYLTGMDKADRHIAKFIVGNIDEDGYLRRTAEELEDDLAFRESLEVPHEKMLDIIRQIKQFDPPGVGAYDLQECLLLQLEQKEQTPIVTLTTKIINEQFIQFSKRHFDRIAARYNLTDEQMHDVVNEVAHLNPRPGSAWTGNITYDTHKQTIIPDFLVENRDGKLIVQLLDANIPDLRVSSDYKEMLNNYAQRKDKLTGKEKETVQFVKSKIDAARWFIDAIRQRNETLTRTMVEIVEFQREFFLDGDDASLKPMIMQDIADRTNYDVSTISRVSNSKYVQTEWGIFPLKHFFSESMMNSEGDDVSTREIKQILREIIENEDKSHPMNDDELVEKMNEAGYQIARRTVSKYRQQMGKTIARLRKEV